MNDGDSRTAWQAAPSDRAPWIRVDLENGYRIDRVRPTFPEAGAWRYALAVSADGEAWRTVTGWESDTDNTGRVRTVRGDFGGGLRFIKISILGWPARQAATLSEPAVGGE